MRYLVKVMAYSGANKAQKEMSNYVYQFQQILLDSDKELEAFKIHISLKVDEVNEDNKRCKPLVLDHFKHSNSIGLEKAFQIDFYEVIETRFPKFFHAKDTYRRVDYLVRKAKEEGFHLNKDNKTRTFHMPPNQFTRLTTSKYLRELQRVHNYGFQQELPHGGDN